MLLAAIAVVVAACCLLLRLLIAVVATVVADAAGAYANACTPTAKATIKQPKTRVKLVNFTSDKNENKHVKQC